ncbi:MAG: hypothetical protein ATN36_09025 [Epulopiscium sp. Nele67-Bin005]|nr:MAG: hypothetical protein ATN36_09025 [Epulopiscium sp. Nele67-Bin005]
MAKNKVEVIIGGQIYPIYGEESSEHIQKVGTMINTQMSEIQKTDSGKRLSVAQVAILTAMNIASNNLKIQKELEDCISELQQSDHDKVALLERTRELNAEINRFKMEAKMKTKK